MSTTNGTITAPVKVDYSSDQEVRWCPGCGDYSILKQVQTPPSEHRLCPVVVLEVVPSPRQAGKDDGLKGPCPHRQGPLPLLFFILVVVVVVVRAVTTVLLSPLP